LIVSVTLVAPLLTCYLVFYYEPSLAPINLGLTQRGKGIEGDFQNKCRGYSHKDFTN